MSAEHTHVEGFRHEALLYGDRTAFVNAIVPFLQDGIAADEPILVVESAEKVDLLRTALDRGAECVMFADMAEVGANPARIIPAWHDFVKRFGAGGKRLRGIGEPIWKGRPADELAESQRHEALLNVAFGDGQPWWLLCPYDTSQMDESVIEEALRSHEYVTEGGRSRLSDKYVGVASSAAPFEAPLTQPPHPECELAFDVDTLLNLRAEASRFALRHGLNRTRAALLVTALNEIATNSVVHARGTGRLRLWREGAKLVGEIRDSGRFDRPLADRVAPIPHVVGDARGLWLANQVCDLVQIRRAPEGSIYRVHMNIDVGGAPAPSAGRSSAGAATTA